MSRQNYNIDQIRLPKGFADQVIELQIKMDCQEFTFQSLQKLHDLYRTAVEYYIVINPKRAQYFQKKITTLLSQPLIQDLMDGERNGKVRRVKSQAPEQMKHELNKFNYQKEYCVKNMIESGDKRIAHSQHLVKEEMESQEKKIRERMLNRVKSRERVL